MKSYNVLYICVIICIHIYACWAFYFQINKDLPWGSKIFDLSFAKSQRKTAEYYLSSNEANQLSENLFFVDKYQGTLHYMPNNFFPKSAVKNIFCFTIHVKHKHFNYSVPFEVSFEDKEFYKNDTSSWLQHSMKVFSLTPSINHMIFKKCPNHLVPSSICSCSISNSTNFLSKSHVIVKQYISNCSTGNIVFPIQQFDVEINVLQKPKKMHRHRRNSNQRLHFTQPRVTFEILENKPINSVVGRIQAYENGAVARGVIYGLQAMENIHSLEKFGIDETGTIYTKVILDHEQYSRHQFRVTASRSNAHQARTILIINVQDVNDNRPEFVLSDGYQIQIEENQALDNLVFKINAYDADDGANGQVTYSLMKITPSTGSKVFEITTNGDIVVRGNVDREEQAQYNLIIKAQDEGTPSLSNTIRITINVEDQNDNWPQFSESRYIARVSENERVGKRIGRVLAYDRDAGRNGEVTYSLIQGTRLKKFRLNQTTGEVFIKERLDYEEAYASSRAKYTLTIRASDGGRPPHSNMSGVMDVYVLDINDNAPQFSTSSYHFDVRENAGINSLVGYVEASDQDHGVNARISYSISPKPSQTGYRMFAIDQTTGAVKVAKELDYETRKHYQFTVKASDNGQSRRFAETLVYVTIHDVNDNAPQFTKAQYHVKIAEDTDIGHEVLVVNATDPDEQTSGGITYYIIDGDVAKKFSMVTSENAGVIKLNKHLDYNEQQLYRLVVRASDGMNSNTTIVSIVVSDTNSHSPVFDQSFYSISLKEDVGIGSRVVTVHATDEDVGENAQLSYCFIGKINDFAINASSGEIRTSSILDFEKDPEIQLTVRARDHGIPRKSGEAVVVIYLQDSNDNAPQFDQRRYYANVSEDSTPYAEVIRIHATDRDSGSNARIQYTFENGNDGNGDFTIDFYTGRIRTNGMLDRESISQYQLVAYAVDGGHPQSSTSVTVVVNILDVDDNPPSFENDTLIYYVKEDVAVGHVIARIQAKDPDLLSEFAIRYDLGHDPLLLREWHLNPRTGELKTLHKLDYETRKNYEFTVTASSNNLVNQAVVKIFVEDCNDNPPKFNDFEIFFNNYRTRTKRSFPHGVIGKVPAYDIDVKDKLRYRFISGNNEYLLFLNESTGEIRLNPSLDGNRKFNATLRMEVSDGIHRARATCTLKVTSISDEMLQHSITVRVQHMNDLRFLSPAVFYQFTDGLASVLNTSSSNIFVFNVQNDTDVQGEVLNVSFSARKDSNNFYSSKYLQNQVYLNRQKLAKITNRNVLPFDDNICLREPCLNYKRCTSVLTFDSSAPFISSASMIFRPIHPVYKLKCECPIGFTNDESCEDEVDLCYSAPCMNGGNCVSREGGYTCVCKPRFTGTNCEINFDNALCTQHPGVCANGGVCRDDANHISCDCDSTAERSDRSQLSETCELLSRQFKPGNFLTLPGISKQWHFTLSLRFVTLEKNGLLFYNGRLNHQHDFMALEIVDGQVQLNFSTGGGWNLVNPHINGGVNDGQWHTVKLKYYNQPKPGALPHGILDRLGPSSSKLVTLTVDPDLCDDVIASHWNPAYGNYTCSKQVKQTSPKKSLDLTSPLLLGGVPDLPEDYQVRSKSFTGCLANLYLDEKLVDLAQFVANNGSLPGCPTLVSKCNPQKCLNYGVCSPKYGGFKCDCDDTYAGQRCEKRRNNFVVDISGGGCLRYISSSSIPHFELPWHYQLSFRTYDVEAVLMQITLGLPQEAQLILKLVDRQLVYEAAISQPSVVLRVDGFVNDGKWHDVSIDWSSPEPSVGQIKIALDYHLKTNRRFSISSLHQMSVNSLFLGGKKDGRSKAALPFTGCLQNIQFSSGLSRSRIYSLNADRLVGLDGGSFTRVCQSGGCQNHRCPTNSKCVEEWTRYRCECNKGYVGDNCLSICSLGLCQNNGQCRIDGSNRGFSCRCSGNFYGETCEKQLTTTCPPGWYGNGMCAPCNCSADFDPICDSKTGKCSCKTNHYKRQGSCLPCNCYVVGSNRMDCADNTGLCHCKRDVVGRRCTKCTNQHAEVTSKGCQVHYGQECPNSWEDGILWHRTAFGKESPQRCPRGSKGVAFRSCDKTNLWSSPDLSNCTSDSFYDVALAFADVQSGKSPLITNSIPISFNLSSVTKRHEIEYENDVIYSARLLSELLNYESKLSGFNLSAGMEQSYTDNLVQTSSWLLSNESIEFWRRIEKKSPRRKESASAPLLLQSWEQYVANMLKNLHLIHYNDLRSTSSNFDVVMTTVPRDALTDKGFVYGHHRDGVEDVRVTLPRHMLKHKPSTGNSSQADLPTVGLMTFRHMNEILPLAFVDDRTFSIPRRPSINSVVTSVQFHNKNWKSDSAHFILEEEPVVITFRINDPTATGATCVFWNHTAKKEGWSHAGCNLDSSSNSTHARCKCYHLTTFALLTDQQQISIASVLHVTVLMGVGVAISILLLLATLIASFHLPGVKSVRAVVIRNLCIAIVFADLIFVVGIQQISSRYGCMAVAVILHFFLLATFAWVVVDGLHLYRKLTELRDINHGPTRVYYVLGWILPSIVTALSVGLDAKEFGNNSFCYISIDKTLIWSFAGPLLLCFCTCLLLLAMSVHAFLSSKRADMKRAELSFEMKASFTTCPVVLAKCFLAVFALNINMHIFFYLFALLCILQGLLIFLFNCFLNHEVREAYEQHKQRSVRKANLNTTRQGLLHSFMHGTTPESSSFGGLPRFNNSTSESLPASNRVNSPMLPPSYPGESDESDDDTSSDSSMSLGSSSCDEQAERNTYRNIQNMKLFQEEETTRRVGNGNLPRNGKPKLSVKKKLVIRSVSDESEGSNETSV